LSTGWQLVICVGRRSSCRPREKNKNKDPELPELVIFVLLKLKQQSKLIPHVVLHGRQTQELFESGRRKQRGRRTTTTSHLPESKRKIANSSG
jgi:hypothetical protein